MTCFMDEFLAMAAEEVRQEIANAGAQGMKHSERLLKYELERLENNGEPELVEVDIPKPVKVAKRVLIPSHRHPHFNFVGKLIGPGGKTLQGLAKNFKCRVFVLGRGSTKDRAKEEEQLNSGDPKFAHFAGPLHVRVETEAPIPIAYTRISGVLNELHRILQPVRDDIVTQQMEELNQNQGEGGEGEAVEGDEGGDEGATPSGGGDAGQRGGRGGARGRGRGAPRGRGAGRGRGGGRGGTPGFGQGHFGSYGGAAGGGGGDNEDGGGGGGETPGGASGFDFSKMFGFGGGKMGAGRGADRPTPY